jgi:hypothetical protein
MEHRYDDISVSEWARRVICALLAFSVVPMGAIGMMVVVVTTVSPSVETHQYGVALCTGLACLSSSFGLPPLAIWINRHILASMGSLSALPPRTED